MSGPTPTSAEERRSGSTANRGQVARGEDLPLRRRLPSQIIDVDDESARQAGAEEAKNTMAWSLILATVSLLFAGAWYLVKGEVSSTIWLLVGAAGAFGAVFPIARMQARQRGNQAAKMWDAAVTNPLTGLPNRTVFLVELERALVRSMRREEPMALMLVDIDNLSEINQLCGRNVGDNVLVEVGQRLDRNLRLSDVVTHISGDEFAVILEPVKGPEGAKAVGARIRDAVRMDVPMHGDTERTTVSVGLVMATAESAAPELLTRADEAVAIARNMGGNMVHILK